MPPGEGKYPWPQSEEVDTPRWCAHREQFEGYRLPPARDSSPSARAIAIRSASNCRWPSGFIFPKASTAGRARR